MTVPYSLNNPPSPHAPRTQDWNVPESVRAFIADVDYVRANKTVFTGTTAVGFVGVLNGIKRGAFSVSIDARQKGGKIDVNILQVRPRLI